MVSGQCTWCCIMGDTKNRWVGWLGKNFIYRNCVDSEIMD